MQSSISRIESLVPVIDNISKIEVIFNNKIYKAKSILVDNNTPEWLTNYTEDKLLKHTDQVFNLEMDLSQLTEELEDYQARWNSKIYVDVIVHSTRGRKIAIKGATITSSWKDKLQLVGTMFAFIDKKLLED